MSYIYECGGPDWCQNEVCYGFCPDPTDDCEGDCRYYDCAWCHLEEHSEYTCVFRARVENEGTGWMCDCTCGRFVDLPDGHCSKHPGRCPMTWNDPDLIALAVAFEGGGDCYWLPEPQSSEERCRLCAPDRLCQWHTERAMRELV